MAQLIACATPKGIVAASDSRSEFFEPDGKIRSITQERLMPLTSHTVLASAGAWESQDICREFATFVKSEGITDLDAMIEAAMPFFTGKYDEIMRKVCTIFPPDPIVNFYLLLAGYSPKTPDNPYRMFVIWDRPQKPKIESNRVTHIFTLPRRMGLEFTLNSLVVQAAPLDKVLATIKEGFAKLAAKDDSIGPPYHYLTVTDRGVEKVG